MQSKQGIYIFKVTINLLVPAFVFHHLTTITLKPWKVLCQWERNHNYRNLCSVLLFSWRNKMTAVWLNDWVFIYKLSGCGFESCCSHLNFRYRGCFERGVPWYLGNNRVWIHPETRTWHSKNMQSRNAIFLVPMSHLWKSILGVNS